MTAIPFTPFEQFFRTATAGQSPFAYQRRLAVGEGSGEACVSRLIDVPTGCGKTAGVVLAWLWNRVVLEREDWPRRLVYCLPMRTLVEQTHGAVKGWLERTPAAKDVGLHLLMGGEEAGEWDTHPERDAILIGTQDMLLSRALNRGYGMSRYRWPMAFGLLNNDCLWVFDETQLMGVGVETGAQMEGFRTRLGTAQTPCASWWMSATLDDRQLTTVDHPKPSEGWPTVRLEGTDLEPGSEASRRREAGKRLLPANVRLGGEEKADTYPKQLAGFILEKHRAAVRQEKPGAGILTLVVLNRVPRARAVYQQLLQQSRKEGQPENNLALIHSRFRPGDRRRHEKVLFADGTDRIVIATQAIEAGVDVSARVLITELAPWPSLVQRFGRCNRRGEWNETGGAEIFWIDLQPKDGKDELVLPHAFLELKTARALLRADLPNASPRALAEVAYSVSPVVRSVIRRKDLLDLFDTTPDLLGHDLDIGRYVRDGDDTDVQVFWRNVPADPAVPDADESDETRPELCRASLAEMRRFLKKKPRAFVWNALDETWAKAGDTPRPGQTYLVAHDAGGYDDRLGWTGEPVPKGGSLSLNAVPSRTDSSKPKGYGGNEETFLYRWLSLAGHTRDVVRELEPLIKALPLTETEAAALRDAARWHDLGKAHAAFQAMLRRSVTEPPGPGEACPDPSALWAKSAGRKRRPQTSRKGFRHELASALAWLQRAPADLPAERRDLTAFVIAAHHGKVRLSIRSLPDEAPRPDDPNQLHARGVWDGDPLPGDPFPSPVVLEGVSLDRLPLDLGYMKMGNDQRANGRGPSWLARMVALRDSPEFGPFRLAYLETLLRAADWRGSATGDGR